MASAAIPNPVMAQMRAILDKDPQADRVALVWPELLDPDESLQQISGTTLRFVYCPSELAMCERLVTHAGGATRLVMLTPDDETRLANDLLARLWCHEPKRISPWRTLEQLLHVRQIDPRLTGKGYRWIAEALVSSYDRYLKGHPYSDLNTEFSHAEQVLASLDLMPLTVESDLFPAAFSLRLDRFAKALKRSIGGKAMQQTRDALAALQGHQLAKVRKDQVRTAELAVRACAWLQTDELEQGNARAEIEDYIESGGYLDWARSRI